MFGGEDSLSIPLSCYKRGEWVMHWNQFWKLLADPAFEGFAKDGPKTWRKLNGVMCLATIPVWVIRSGALNRSSGKYSLGAVRT